MKKILSLLMLMLLCTTAWAAEVTFDFDANYATLFPTITGTSSSNSHDGDITTNVTATVDGVELVVTPSGQSTANRIWNASPRLRMYGGSMTITAPGKITEVIFTWTSKWNADNKINGETPSDISSPITWTSANGVDEVVLTVAGNTQLNSVKVTYTSSASTLAKPTILINNTTPATSYYVSDLPLSLTITSNNGNETPYYHYSFADDPETVSSTIRAGATELTTGESSALNLKVGSNKLWVAEAIPNSETQQWSSSQWASATFTIKEDPTTVTTVADLNALTDGTEFVFNNTVTVLGQSGTNLYVQDANNGTFIYGSIGQTYVFGDIIPAGFKGTKTTNKGAPRMTNPADFAAKSGNNPPTAIEMTIADVTLANFGRYGVIKGATVAALSGSNSSLTVGDATTTLALFNRFNIAAEDWPVQTKTYDVYGVASYYDGNQFLPLSFVDVTPAAAVETPVITFDKENPVEGETVNCTITCATEGATIMYALGEGEYQNYTAAIPLTETTTVKAKATKGGAESNVATATITFAAAPVEYGKFQLVTSENDLEIDKNYVIVTTAHDFAMGALTTGTNPKGSSATGFTLNNNIVTLDSNTDVMVLKLGKTNAGNLTLAMPDGKYINLTATSGTNITASESATTLTIAIDEDAVATIQGNTSRQILYQYGSANVFGNYASSNASNTTSYCTISLYKETEEVVPQPTYTITLDKQPGEYATLINVKATVEPALPEGATLKYTIDDADPVAYDSEKGVSLLKSSILKFTAYDAQNNALTDPVGGQYKYIVNVFGDMDGDGEVTVTDLNIVLNLILGKI